MAVKLGHVHLKVTDAGRSERFYADLLGFETHESLGPFRFMSGGDAHHELALQSHPSAGLYHVAFEVSDEGALEEVTERLRNAGVDYVAVDHGISHSVYFHDPDGLGVEVYLDRRGRPGGTTTWHGNSRPLQI